jgi:plastocyanin
MKGTHMRFTRRFAAFSVTAIVPLLLVGAVTAAPQAESITVTATDSAFKLSADSAPVGKVTFTVTNTGKAQHNFGVAGKTTRTLSTGQSAKLGVTFTKAGSYAYRSTIKGDAARGLKGTFRLVVPQTFPPITVLAAASLTDVFPAIDKDEKYSFGGSNALATQIRNGAPADVFASANTDIPAQLFQQGFVEKPVNFTRNTLVIVVPKANPAGINTVYDLTKSGIKLDIAASSVPVGSYTLQVLRQMGLSARCCRTW